jgi:hypothetical protein
MRIQTLAVAAPRFGAQTRHKVNITKSSKLEKLIEIANSMLPLGNTSWHYPVNAVTTSDGNVNVQTQTRKSALVSALESVKNDENVN